MATVQNLYVKVYVWGSSGWSQRGLTINVNTVNAKAKISGDGNRVVIGDKAYSSNKGIAQTYEWNGSAWSQVGGNFIGSSNQLVGTSVSVNYNGDRICTSWNAGAKLEQNRSRI